MNKVDVTAIEIRDFARSLGWTFVKEAVADGLFVLNSPDDDDTQLIFPKETNVSEFNEAAYIAIKRLSDFYSVDYNRLIEDIREVYDDVISLRYYSDTKTVNSLLFENVLKSIEATRQLILSAASSIINPTIYHPRLNRIEPLELIRKTKFRHTREGSFMLKISCPIEITNGGGQTLFGEDYKIPLSRKAFSLINKSSFDLVNIIESNNEEKYIEEQLNSSEPTISYNFCDAISNLFDDNIGLPFELGFVWSRNSLNKIQHPDFVNRIKYAYEYKSKIDDIKVYFKKGPSELTESFIATVESLNGDPDESGNRSGDVRLNILLGSEMVNAKVMLKPEYYVIAHEAHIKPGSYVRVTGTLHPGKQIRLLDSITDFTVI